ncbi:helix-turn-helix domain-containing protein [Actinomadura sp. 3N407]|uniref:PucR family transcriptional regulator n=1 Tax=Actinomadura sp. 3N407 TaxID=3457423 RepID=UPI003FCCC680
MSVRKHHPVQRHASHRGLDDLLRPYTKSVVDEVTREIRRQLPEYAQPSDSEYGRRVQETISVTVEHFIDTVGRPAYDREGLAAIYARLGAHEARKGRALDSLQNAMRLSSQVACRRFIEQAYRLGWPSETLALLTDSMFLLLGTVANAAAEGYAAAQEKLASARERHRNRLRDLLVVDPPPSLEALTDLSRAADWGPTSTIGVIALRRPVSRTAHVVPPMVLADWEGPAPYLVVPDPDGPGQDRLLARLVREHPGVIGPTVPLNRGAVSLLWARRAVELVERGVLPCDGVVRCVDHVAVLAASLCEDLIDAAAVRHLGPLLKLPAHRRRTLAATLLLYLNCGDNAITAAERLHVHPQTVRYRIRSLQEMYGGDIVDPDTRLDMSIALNALLRFPAPAATSGTAADPSRDSSG